MAKRAAVKTDEAAVEGKKKRRLTPKQWAEAEALYESGEMTQTEIARKFDITPQSVFTHMKGKGLVAGSKAQEHKKRVAEEVTKAAIDDATIHAGRIRETKEEHYKMSAGIAKLAWSEILKAKSEGAPVSVAMNNLKALDAAMNVLTKARMERWAVLGLDRDVDLDEDGLPELLISELTAEQIEELRQRDFSEFEELPEDGEGQVSGEDEVVEEG